MDSLTNIIKKFQALFAGSIPEIIDIVKTFPKYNGTYISDRGRRHVQTITMLSFVIFTLYLSHRSLTAADSFLIVVRMQCKTIKINKYCQTFGPLRIHFDKTLKNILIYCQFYFSLFTFEGKFRICSCGLEIYP